MRHRGQLRCRWGHSGRRSGGVGLGGLVTRQLRGRLVRARGRGEAACRRRGVLA